MLLLLASILIWQIMRTSDRDEKEKIGQWIFGSLGLLILINAVYITHTAISNWLRKRRIRALKKKHDEAMEKRKTQTKEKRLKLLKDSDDHDDEQVAGRLAQINEEVEEDDDES